VLEFARAARRVAESHPNVRFVLVGPDDTDSVDRLDEAELGELRTSLDWLGPRDDVRDLMAASDVFALPTWYREGIPRVLLEAASMELPLVASRMPGCEDAVRSGWNGTLVTPKDPESLADAIGALAADGDRRRLFGGRSREMAVSVFGLEVIAEATARSYRETGARQ
jgi:glycosyltransferase involved in cell wall biosynthesis